MHLLQLPEAFLPPLFGQKGCDWGSDGHNTTKQQQPSHTCCLCHCWRKRQSYSHSPCIPTLVNKQEMVRRHPQFLPQTFLGTLRLSPEAQRSRHEVWMRMRREYCINERSNASAALWPRCTTDWQPTCLGQDSSLLQRPLLFVTPPGLRTPPQMIHVVKTECSWPETCEQKVLTTWVFVGSSPPVIGRSTFETQNSDNP